jgi:hypothetical protein
MKECFTFFEYNLSQKKNSLVKGQFPSELKEQGFG